MAFGSHSSSHKQTFSGHRSNLSSSKEAQRSSQTFLHIKSPKESILLKAQGSGLLSTRPNRSLLEISSPVVYPSHIRTGTEWNLSSSRLINQPPKTQLTEPNQGMKELTTKIKSLEKANEELTTQMCTVMSRNLELCKCMDVCEERMKRLVKSFSELQLPGFSGDETAPPSLETSLTITRTQNRTQSNKPILKSTDLSILRKEALHLDRYEKMNRTTDTSQIAVGIRTIKAREKDNYSELLQLLDEAGTKGESLILKNRQILTFLQSEKSLISPMLKEVLILTNFIERLKRLVTACENGTLDSVVNDLNRKEAFQSISSLEDGQRLLKTAQKSIGEIEDQLISWYADLCGSRCSIY